MSEAKQLSDTGEKTRAAPDAPHFDRIARPYRWLEYLSFGPLLQHTRTHWLSAISNCRSALVLGDGDGRFTAALLAANPEIRIHAVDLSPAMLNLLAYRCNAANPAMFSTETADLRLWSPPANARYDLVATHFFLDCLTTEEISALAQRLTPAITPEATWLVSDFAIPRTPYGRWIAAPIVAVLYRAFALLTGLGVRRLPDHAAALKDANWRLERRHHRLGGLLVSQFWKRS